jgi:hypothetical protein
MEECTEVHREEGPHLHHHSNNSSREGEGCTKGAVGEDPCSHRAEGACTTHHLPQEEARTATVEEEGMTGEEGEWKTMKKGVTLPPPIRPLLSFKGVRAAS